MKINGEFVMTVGAGKNMKDKLVSLANNKGYVDRNNFIYVGKADFEEEGYLPYINGTKVALNVEDFESFEAYSEYEFVGFSGNTNTYLYR